MPKFDSAVGAATLSLAALVSFCSTMPSANIRSERVTLVLGCQEEDIYRFIGENRDAISSAGKKHNVPQEIIAATILNENECRPKYHDWFDTAASALGMNPSIGIAQMRIETARGLYKANFGRDITTGEIEKMLMEKEWAIEFISMFYREEMRDMKIGRTEAGEMHNVAELISRYAGGRKYRSQCAEISGYNGLMHTTDERLWKSIGKEHYGDAREKINNFVRSRLNGKDIKRIRSAI